jgi:hypothetical protein
VKDEQIELGQRLIDGLARQGFDVSAACWVKPRETGEWLLYVVSKVVDEQGAGAAFRAVHPMFKLLPSLSLSDLKLVGTQTPLAADVLEIQRQFPGRSLTRTRRPRLGEMTRDEVLRTIASLMSRTGLVPPATMTLRDGSTVRGVPMSLVVDPGDKVRIAVQELHGPGPRTIDADEVVNVQ